MGCPDPATALACEPDLRRLHRGGWRANRVGRARARGGIVLRRVLIVVGLLGALAAGVASAATLTVTLGSTGPQPKTTTVGWGDTVTFTNADSVAHVITAAKHP